MSSDKLDDNIYYVHGLFLDKAELDVTALKDTLNKTKNEWQNDTKKDRVGKAFLALLSAQPSPPKKMLENLADEARRARLRELNTQIAADEADGVLEQEEYDKTVKKFGPGKYFTVETIEKLYKLKVYHFPVPKEPAEISAGIKPTDTRVIKELDSLLDEVRAVVTKEIEEGKPDVLSEKFGLDFGLSSEIQNAINRGEIETREELEKALPKFRENAKREVEKVKSIYDILFVKYGISSESRYTDLQQAIDNAIMDVISIMSNPRGSALYKLFGKFKGENGIFVDERSKKGFNLALKMKPFNSLADLELNGIAVKNKGGRISKGEYEHSLKRARDEKCWEAEWCIYNYYINHKKLKPPAEPIKNDRTLQCSVCETYNEQKANGCMACGSPLKVECPKCSSDELFASPKCTQCGFVFGDMHLAISAFENAKVAIATGDIVAAEKFMRQVNTYWRDCPGADTVRRNIEEVKREREEVQGKIDTAEKEVRIALGQRRLYESQRLILKLRELPQAKSYLVKEEQDVNKNLADIRAKLAQLPKLSDTDDKKIDICEEILAIATDCEEAQIALQRALEVNPPKPPRNLSAKVNIAGSVDLTWINPASRRPLKFRVVRKENAAPASQTDGQMLTDDLSNTTFTDSQCEIGVIYGYAVFTKRDKVCEQIGCRSQLIQRIGELATIKVLPADSNVTFAWTKPANCLGIQVTRYQSGSAQGTRLQLQHETGFTDSGLHNGMDYTYLFQCVFRTADGKNIETAGIKRTVKPQLPPSAVLDLRTTGTADGMTAFRWTPPARGEMLLFDLASVPDIPVGQTEADTPLELKKKYGEPIPLLNPQQGQTHYKNTTTGVRYIVPFTIHNDLFTIGKSITLLRVQDVTNLEARISGTRLFVSWEWQKGQEKALLVYRNDRQPEGDKDPRATKQIVTRQDYNREKAVVLSAENTQDFYINVYSVVSHNGEEVPSSGVRTQTGVSVIDWKFVVRRKFYLFGPVTSAKIQVERRSGKGIPDLVVRKDFNRRPLKRDFGDFVMEIPASLGLATTVDFDIEQFADDTFFQIFVKEEKAAGRYAFYGQSDEIIRFTYYRRTFKDFALELLLHPIRSFMQIRTQIQQEFRK